MLGIARRNSALTRLTNMLVTQCYCCMAWCSKSVRLQANDRCQRLIGITIQPVCFSLLFSSLVESCLAFHLCFAARNAILIVIWQWIGIQESNKTHSKKPRQTLIYENVLFLHFLKDNDVPSVLFSTSSKHQKKMVYLLLLPRSGQTPLNQCSASRTSNYKIQ